MGDVDPKAEDLEPEDKPTADAFREEPTQDSHPSQDPFSSVLNTRLLHLLGAGDRSAFSHLLSLEEDSLRHYIERKLPPHVRGPIGPDDIFQEVVIALARKSEEGELEGINTPAFRGLVYKIADGVISKEVAKAHAKKRDIARKASPPRSAGGGSTSSSDPLNQVAARGESPSKAAHIAEQLEALQRSLDEMSPDELEVIHLRDYEELDFAAIARRLSISAEAARQRYHRARERLRILFRRKYPDSL